MAVIERNCPSLAEFLEVTYDKDYEEYVVSNKGTHASCGRFSHNAVKAEYTAKRIEEPGREMFEAGYRRAQQDIRKALGIKS